MTEELKKTIKEEIGKLPKEGQEAINSVDWVNIAGEIGNKNSLDEDQINDLQVETLLVLTGLEDLELYPDNIEYNVGMTKEEAAKIGKEAYDKIFAPISSIIQENVKKNLKNKNPNWKQNLNFTLSGGDYSAFLENDKSQTPENPIPVKPPVVLRDDLVM